ncbi:MAG TPA: peptide chain release factor N(5)-glutamine methyltransferase [Candidatus Polarisedimenticolaceae bacterium]|nr:peptide chain release factor N(5)-glutamine methyltransferase [Candidatus Polarisedimenticolaceae bacterium]
MGEDGSATIAALLTEGVSRLTTRGLDTPRLDCEILLAHALGIDRSRLAVQLAGGAAGEPGSPGVPPAAAAAFRALIERRTGHEPVAYLTGKKEFWSLEFEVGPGVLIPRPETELLVRQALSLLPPAGAGPVNVADVGTGSGAIAVALAVERPDLMILAVDISDAALEMARRNVRRHKVTSRVFVERGDLLMEVLDRPDRFPPFQMVVSNPPYIGLLEREGLMPDVRDHEPAEALFSGPEGMEAIERLAPQAAQVLAPGGWFLLEVASHRARDVARWLEEMGLWQDVLVIDDYTRLPRAVQARRVTRC